MEDNIKDPVAFCIQALETGPDKEVAFQQAVIAHENWWVIKSEKEAPTLEEINQMLMLRSIVFATIASVYVWNDKGSLAAEIEEEFLYDEALWTEQNIQVIEMYLTQLIVQKQFEHLHTIFKHAAFREHFLVYEDAYLSCMNPDYEYKSRATYFSNLINRLNNYSRMLSGKRLM